MNAHSGQREVKLSRDLGLLEVTMIGVGAMIGAGIFVLTGIAAGQAGPALMLAFFLNGLVALLTAMAYAELAAAFPEAGGGYLWVHEAIPGGFGFLTGWISWMGHSVACSVYTLGFGAYLGELLKDIVIHTGLHSQLSPSLFTGDLFMKAAGVVICGLFTYINFRGASETGKAEALVTFGKLAILALFIGSGMWALFRQPDWTANFRPFFPRGLGGLFAAMGLTYIAFEGYEIIAQSGEEVKNPQRNLPIAILLSIAIVVPIYILVAFVSIGAIRPLPGQTTWQTLGDLGELGIVEAARQFMVGGRFIGGLILLVGGLFSTISALNATVYSSSRVSFAMGRDRSLPDFFAAIHPVRRTPHVAVLISGALIALMAVALPIKDVASAADVMFLLMFVLINISVIGLRRRRPDLKRSFRVPLVPYIPLLAAVISLALTARLFIDSPKAGLVTIVWLAAGTLLYRFYGQRREIAAKRTPIVIEHAPLVSAQYRVLVPVANPRHIDDLMTLAAAVARQRNGEVAALNVITVPQILPIQEAVRFRPQAERVLAMAEEVGRRWGVPVRTIARAGHFAQRGILDTIVEYHVDLTVIGWRGWTGTGGKVMGTVLDPVVRHARSDLAVLKPVGALREARRILVCVTGHPQATLYVRVAKAIADLVGAEVDFVHFVREGDPPPERLIRFWQSVDDPQLRIELQIRYAASATTGIIAASENYDLIILGAAREPLIKQTLFGTRTRAVARMARCSVLMVKRRPGRAEAAIREMFTPVEEEERRQVDLGDEDEQ